MRGPCLKSALSLDLKLKLFVGAISIIYHELGRPGQSNLEDNGGMLQMQCKHWLVTNPGWPLVGIISLDLMPICPH